MQTDALTIRLAHPSEHQVVAELVDAAYSKWIPVIGRKPKPMLADYADFIAKEVVYVAHHEGELAAVLVIWPIEDAMLIENIAVYPNFQRSGVGRVLMDFAEQKARDAGLNMMRLYTNAKMTANQEYYRKLGYEETERKLTAAGGTIVWMHKHL